MISCSGLKDAGSVLKNEKKKTTDEFLVKKKDPLILPPDFESLPEPDEKALTLEESSIFENSIVNEDEDPSSSNSVESSILKKIQSK